MLGRLIHHHATERADSTAVVHAGVRCTYGELERLACDLASVSGLAAGKRIGVAIASPARLVAALAALDRAGAKAFLLGVQTPDETGPSASSLGLHAVWDEETRGTGSAAKPCDRAGTVTLLTSGTTGEPKAIEHDWETLARPVRTSSNQGRAVWLCAYPLRLYAGLQVMLQALVNGATLVIPGADDLVSIARLLSEERITHASGTPTFWRQLCLFGDRAALQQTHLEQVTLGGEAVPQELLDRLAKTFSNPRVVHIYASTELGRLFSVTDGREGFPAAYLDEVPGGSVALEIRDGELHARSANARLGCTDWVATGDLVERCEDRVLFRGRRSEFINVGGSKVSPIKVESALRQTDGVADIRVYATRSSLAGQLVTCDVVAAQGHETDVLRKSLLENARSRLSPPERPRIVKFVERIEQTSAMKVARGEIDA